MFDHSGFDNIGTTGIEFVPKTWDPSLPLLDNKLDKTSEELRSRSEPKLNNIINRVQSSTSFFMSSRLFWHLLSLNENISN